MAHLNSSPPRPSALNPEIPVAAETVILRALAKAPDQRFGTAGEFQRALAEAATAPPPGTDPTGTDARQVGSGSGVGSRTVIVYRRDLEPDSTLRDELERHLTEAGHRVFVDTHLTVGVEWARAIEAEIRSADAVVALISARSIESEMLECELQLAAQTAEECPTSRPRILPIRVGYEGGLPDELAAILDPLEYALWKSPADTPDVVRHIEAALRGEKRLPPSAEAPATRLYQSHRTDSGAVGGAVPIGSRFYISRPSDEIFLSALDARDSIVLVKGARQMGKTSLLARGMGRARERGLRVALTDFQKLTAAHLESLEGFFMALGERIADQLDLDVLPSDMWRTGRDPNLNFERYLRRHVLDDPAVHVVWGMDEVDRLFSADFGGDVFALFRSWHNERSLDPQGPWGRLTLAIAYATEAHLFITDLNQSPFNVGTRVELRDFDRVELAELNERYGAPLGDETEIARYETLVGGHPYLTRRGLHELSRAEVTLDLLEATADREDGPFSDHLRRILVSTARNPELYDALRGLLEGRPPDSDDAFYRLRSGGLVRGASRRDAEIRCAVYARYLDRHLT